VKAPARNSRGFTSIEVLVAMLILSIGLAAVAIGLQHASSGIETARGETTAAFLAEDRLEQLKNLALTDWPSPTLKAGTATEGYGTVPHASAHRRVTTITDNPGSTCTESCKLVRITVFYRAVTAEGQLDQERRLDVVTMLVSRM
jgi:prepilin-type N-terminal cleavage/methylation domain-containing protein